MKKAFLTLIGVLLLGGVSWAECYLMPISKKLDERNNIEIHSQYFCDGIEVTSPYAKEDGKYYWVTRYSGPQNFLDKTKAEKRVFIETSLRLNVEGQVYKAYKKKVNQDILDNDLDWLIGSTITATEVKRGVDENGDGIPDKEYTFKSDGTHTSKPIVVQP